MSNLRDDLSQEIKNKIVIVEGFDMVGKTTAVEDLLPGYTPYFANLELTDRVVGRDNSWVIGYGILDLLRQISQSNQGLKEKIVVNRGVVSSYVYPQLYHHQKPMDTRVLEWYSKDEFFKNKVTHLYVSHHDENSARQIYESSLSRECNPNELSAKYDKFCSFEEYWETYKLADDLFNSTYRRLQIQPLRVETSENFTYLIEDSTSVRRVGGLH